MPDDSGPLVLLYAAALVTQQPCHQLTQQPCHQLTHHSPRRFLHWRGRKVRPMGLAGTRWHARCCAVGGPSPALPAAAAAAPRRPCAAPSYRCARRGRYSPRWCHRSLRPLPRRDVPCSVRPGPARRVSRRSTGPLAVWPGGVRRRRSNERCPVRGRGRGAAWRGARIQLDGRGFEAVRSQLTPISPRPVIRQDRRGLFLLRPVFCGHQVERQHSKRRRYCFASGTIRWKTGARITQDGLRARPLWDCLTRLCTALCARF